MWKTRLSVLREQAVAASASLQENARIAAIRAQQAISEAAIDDDVESEYEENEELSENESYQDWTNDGIHQDTLNEEKNEIEIEENNNDRGWSNSKHAEFPRTTESESVEESREYFGGESGESNRDHRNEIEYIVEQERMSNRIRMEQEILARKNAEIQSTKYLNEIAEMKHYIEELEEREMKKRSDAEKDELMEQLRRQLKENQELNARQSEESELLKGTIVSLESHLEDIVAQKDKMELELKDRKDLEVKESNENGILKHVLLKLQMLEKSGSLGENGGDSVESCDELSSERIGELIEVLVNRIGDECVSRIGENESGKVEEKLNENAEVEGRDELMKEVESLKHRLGVEIEEKQKLMEEIESQLRKYSLLESELKKQMNSEQEKLEREQENQEMGANALKHEIEQLNEEIVGLKSAQKELEMANERLKSQVVELQELQSEQELSTESMISELEEDISRAVTQLSSERKKCQQLESERFHFEEQSKKFYEELEQKANQNLDLEEKVIELEDEVLSAHDEIERLKEAISGTHEQNEMKLQSEINRLLSVVKDGERVKTELCERLERLEVEKKGMESELEVLMNELKVKIESEMNLQSVLEQFQSNQSIQIDLKVESLSREVHYQVKRANELEEKYNLKVEECASVVMQLNQVDRKWNEIEKEVFVKNQRIEQLQNELEKSLSRVYMKSEEGTRGVDEEFVDRRVVKQLIVKYFEVKEPKKKRDVLELMARMLEFDETDRLSVGLNRVSLRNKIGNWVRSGGLEQSTQVSEQWVEFLMRQTDPDNEDNTL